MLPVLVMLVFGTIQAALLYQGRAMLNHAAMLAARAGALHNGDPGEMREALARGLLPLFARAATPQGYAAAHAQASAETAAGAMATIEVLNPTPAAFSDFGRAREEGGGSELPNDTLNYRSTVPGAASGISIQDANLLHVRVTYCFRLIVPLVDRMLHAMLNGADPDPDANPAAPGLRDPFGIRAVAGVPCMTAVAAGTDRRIPIRSEAIVRMQSPFYQANLAGPGTGAPPGDRTPPGTPAPPGGPPPGGSPPGEEPDAPGEPGGPADPGGPCTGPDCPVCTTP